MTKSCISAQMQNRQRFAQAVLYAKNSLTDPAVLETYAAIIHGKERVYIAALKDYMQAPKLFNLQTDSYTGKAGQPIRVQAIDNFRVVSVEFKLIASDGTLLECGWALQSENGFDWIYTTLASNPQPEGTTVLVSAMDLPRNNTELAQVL